MPSANFTFLLLFFLSISTNSAKVLSTFTKRESFIEILNQRTFFSIEMEMSN